MGCDSRRKLQRSELVERLSPQEYVAHLREMDELAMRQKITNFLLYAFAWCIALTFLIYLLQGFHLWSFELDVALLKWLGAATIGEVTGLLMMTYNTKLKTR